MIAVIGNELISAGYGVRGARHFASLAKSRNAVVVPTPPTDVPLARKVIIIKVHITHLLSRRRLAKAEF
jgi:hypothetical protein